MKKFTLFFISLFYFGATLYAQDLIVTTEGDTLNCQITKQRGDNVYFIHNYEGKNRKTLLSLNQIQCIEVNHFAYSEIKNTLKKASELNKGGYNFFIDGGWGFRMGEIKESGSIKEDDYVKKLKNGFCVKAGFHYYLDRYFGVGLEYSFFNASGSSSGIYIPNIGVGSVKDDIRLQYAGATFDIRIPSCQERNAFVISVGMGYLGYKDKGEMLKRTFNLTGNAIGFSWAIGYDFGLSKKMKLGIKFAVISGSLGEITWKTTSYRETQKLEERENISHASLTLGLRFNGK